MPNDNIHVLTGPIRSGKTTLIMEWLKGQPGAVGILTPDVDDQRKLYDIADKTYYDLEVVNDAGTDLIKIGRFHFDALIFQKARDILLNNLKLQPQYLIIDEVGKLELEGRGLEPALSEVISGYLDGTQKGKLILVIRDSLLEKAIAWWKIGDSIILNTLPE